MKTPTPAQKPAKAQRTASPATARMKAKKPKRKNRTLLSNVKRYWTPNSRGRSTRHIKAENALDAIEAAAHAHTIGYPFNLQADIHFECGKLDEDLYRPQDALSRWLRLQGQWLATKGIPSTFWSTMEHETGTGQHVHILLHCPPEHQRAFQKLARTSWIEGAYMSTDNDEAILIQKLGPYRYAVTDSAAKQTTYFNQLVGSLSYRLKGMNPNQALPKQMGVNSPVAELLGITTFDNLPIYGRRTSSSNNIRKTTRDSYAASIGDEPTKAMQQMKARMPYLPF